jgi:hypothetical protein
MRDRARMEGQRLAQGNAIRPFIATIAVAAIASGSAVAAEMPVRPSKPVLPLAVCGRILQRSTITDGVNYQVQVSSSLEDFGDDFALRTDANTVPLFPTPYGAGIDGLTGLGFSLPVRGDFRQLSNDLAYAGKLDFTPPVVPGLGFSVSAYYTPNTTPRGAHDDLGNPLVRTSLTMFDAEFRYRIPKTWLEFRGEYVRAIFGNPINLRANNDSERM